MSIASAEFVHKLPQAGWVLDSELADSIDCSTETLRDWLKDNQIPHRRIGNKVFVQMDEFFDALPSGLPEQKQSQSKPKAKAKGNATPESR